MTDAGDSTPCCGQIVSLRKLRGENSSLKRRDLRPVQVRDIVPATGSADPAGYHPCGFATSASFRRRSGDDQGAQRAAIQAKVDPLENLKENVICGHLIPSSTGLREYDDLVVAASLELETLQQAQPRDATSYEKPRAEEFVIAGRTGKQEQIASERGLRS